MSLDRAREPRSRRALAAALPWHLIVPVLLYLLVSLGSVSQSSIGVPELRQDPSDPAGMMWGEARGGRSDEYLTATPMLLGVAATGETDDQNPLTAPQQVMGALPAGPVTSLLFLDGSVLRLGPVLPDGVLYAARSWLGLLLLLLAVPAWFRSLTGSRRIGYFAAALIVLSPGNAWWSGSHVTLLGFAFAGAVALDRAVRSTTGGRWLPAVGWGVLGAALLVRTPLLYAPWAVVLVPTIVLGTVAAALARPGSRGRALVTIAATGVLTVAFLAVVYWENAEGIRASMDTIYPGARTSTGAAIAAQLLVGATHLGVLPDGTTVVGTNPSEISGGFTVALVVAVLVLVRGVEWRLAGQRAAVVAVLAVTGFWVLWATMDFGTLGGHLPLVNVVPPARAAQVLGHLAVVVLCLALPAARARGSVSSSVLTAGTAVVVAGYGGSLLRAQNLPDLSTADVWLTALGVGAVAFLVVHRPRRPWGYMLGVVLAGSIVWNVNPVIVGLGDLRASEVAREMLAEGDSARSEGDVWVSDHYSTDSLLIATGVPAFSGRQLSGPDLDAWTRLDPGRSHEEVWNRGGSYIWFSWTGRRELVMDNPSPDVIRVMVSPCLLAERLPRLSTVVSSKELDLGCLSPLRTFTWGGSPRWVYSVER